MAKDNKLTIDVLAVSSQSKSPSSQGTLDVFIEKDCDFDGIGMGVLSDGTPYLSQRGLAVLCGVENAHIGNISSQWNDAHPKPRIKKIKDILGQEKVVPNAAHIEVQHVGKTYYCYPADVCLAVLEYYAFDAGKQIQPEAKKNYRLLAGSKLTDLIYRRTGYEPSNSNQFAKWHERLALNFQSAPSGFFHVFNEINPLMFELINAGARIDENFVPDISVGKCWSKYWEDNGLDAKYGPRDKYPHHYPDSHPQSKSNPQKSWCYPDVALGEFRAWLDQTYLKGGKLNKYLSGKVKKGQIDARFVSQAIEVLGTAA